MPVIPTSAAAQLIAEQGEQLNSRIEEELQKYCEEHNWEKLRPYEMARIASTEAVVSMTDLVLRLRTEIEKAVTNG